MPTVHLLDYVAGNVRSLVNAIEKVGYTVEWVKSPADVSSAEVWLGALLCARIPTNRQALMQLRRRNSSSLASATLVTVSRS